MRWMIGLIVALVWYGAPAASAQEVVEETVTVRIELTTAQVKALRVLKRQQEMREPRLDVLPDGQPNPTSPPVLTTKDWIEREVVNFLTSLVAEVERQEGEEIAIEVRRLTPEQKLLIKQQIVALKEKK